LKCALDDFQKRRRNVVIVAAFYLSIRLTSGLALAGVVFAASSAKAEVVNLVCTSSGSKTAVRLLITTA
jgi:hypothetical protein